MFGTLQISQVTGGAKVIAPGPQYYWGFTSFSNPGTTDKTLVVSDSAQSTVTGTNFKTYLTIAAGTTKQTSYINSVWPKPLKIVNGLRAQMVGGKAGTTVFVHYAG